MTGVRGARYARIIAVSGIVTFIILAGCSSLAGADAASAQGEAVAAGSERESTVLQAELDAREAPSAGGEQTSADERTHPEIVREVTERVDDETAAAFESLVTDDAGDLTGDGERLLDRLHAASELGPDQRDAIAESAVERGTLDDEFLDALDRILASPDWFAREALAAGVGDASDDGLTDGERTALGLDAADSDERIVGLARDLGQNGYDNTSVRYLDRVEELREYRGNDYERWAQAEELGLLEEATGNGTVTREQLWQLENNASNGLLNGMEAAFGTDPELADTSGDGYEDHYLWGPLRDLGLNVSADAVNVFVEVDTAAGVDPLTDDQESIIRDTFREEPPEEIGPIAVEFVVCETDHDDVDVVEDMSGFADENRTVTGLGFHYLFLSDGLGDRQVQGAAYVAERETSWMVVDGTLDIRFGETYEASIVAHELGHTLGIGGDDYEGVDSFDVPLEEYDSVMNYNHPGDDITFSTGEPFDDYGHMANESFGSGHQDRDALAAMWDDGEADEDALC